MKSCIEWTLIMIVAAFMAIGMFVVFTMSFVPMTWRLWW